MLMPPTAADRRAPLRPATLAPDRRRAMSRLIGAVMTRAGWTCRQRIFDQPIVIIADPSRPSRRRLTRASTAPAGPKLGHRHAAADRPAARSRRRPLDRRPPTTAADPVPATRSARGPTSADRPQPAAVVRKAARFATPPIGRPPALSRRRSASSRRKRVLRLSAAIDARGRVIAVEPVGKADPAFLAAARRHILAPLALPAGDRGRPSRSPRATVITLQFELEELRPRAGLAMRAAPPYLGAHGRFSLRRRARAPRSRDFARVPAPAQPRAAASAPRSRCW